MNVTDDMNVTDFCLSEVKNNIILFMNAIKV